MPTMYVISGCNGAGKTTASYTILSEMLQCRDFVNSDEIARGISPFDLSHAAIDAGRVMLKRIKSLTDTKEDFAFETTLAVRSYASLIEKTKKKGYEIMLVYFWLKSPDLAVERVQNRVIAGGHSIPENVIRRRYWSGMRNLFNIYIPLSNRWLLINNSETPSSLIAEGSGLKETKIYNKRDYEQLKTLSQTLLPGLNGQ
ncbi:MAG: zeta toxin family protein [Bacteroidales bacterium]